MTLNYKSEVAQHPIFDPSDSVASPVHPPTNPQWSAQLPRSRKLGLWQIDGGPQCSIVGTCLSDEDLRAAIRRHRLSVDANASSYEVHSYCVHVAQTDCPLSRTLTKVLNRRYAGAINLVGKAHSDAEVVSLWDRLRDCGQVAAGYWAIMSDRDVADFIKVRVFGEVHMLSHLHGRGAHQLATKLAETQRRCADLEDRLTRSERSRQAALAERDAVRATLRARDELAQHMRCNRKAMRCRPDGYPSRKQARSARTRTADRASPGPSGRGHVGAYRDRR